MAWRTVSVAFGLAAETNRRQGLCNNARMSRLKDRQHLDVDGRVTLLEEDADTMEQRQRRFDRDVRQIKGLLIGMLIALALASVLLVVDLANGSNLTI